MSSLKTAHFLLKSVKIPRQNTIDKNYVFAYFDELPPTERFVLTGFRISK